MRIVVDRDKCTGMGVCESIASDFFEVADDGTLEVYVDEVTDQRIDKVREAVDGCPAFALRLES
ncbi:MAG TPA: ferredoxin [Nocardioidaceae bacterium]|nr:ferredoxin [Nocardioidaceae bacterium]